MMDHVRQMRGRQATRHSPSIPFLECKLLMTRLVLVPATRGVSFERNIFWAMEDEPLPPGSMLEASLEAGQNKAGPIPLAFNIEPGGEGAHPVLPRINAAYGII